MFGTGYMEKNVFPQKKSPRLLKPLEAKYLRTRLGLICRNCSLTQLINNHFDKENYQWNQ